MSLWGFCFAQGSSPLTLSEVMFYPSESNGEFIEIYNTSPNETIDLSTMKFKYYTSSYNTFVPFIGRTQLAPGKYAIVIQGNYDYENGVYKNLIPASAIVLKLNSNNFGSSGMANATSREVSLLNASDQVVDTYTYSADNSAGYSDEKIVSGKDNSGTNWKNSLRNNGTPGSKNSVSKMDHDVGISLLDITPQFPTAGDSVRISLSIKNLGNVAAVQFTAKLFNDAAKDSLGQPSKLVGAKGYAYLAANDSVVFSMKYLATTISYAFLGLVDYPADENLMNNQISFSIIISDLPILKNELVVNEIMYAPINDEPEWIEIYNNSKRILNLRNCKVGDNSALTTISTLDYFLNPDEYLVICGDIGITTYYSSAFKLIVKSIPSLSNSGDDVIIKNANGQTVDSLKYFPTWGGNTGGKSLERLSATVASTNSSNWKTAFTSLRATPGKKNSAFNPPRYARSALVINEIMYDPETGKAEFLELFNTTIDSVQIVGIETSIGASSKITLSEVPFKIPPKEYFVVSSDSSIFQRYFGLSTNKYVVVNKNLGLSNEGTSVVIKDFYNTTLDSLSYSPGWHNKNFLVTKGKSLERLNAAIISTDKSNWNSCVAAEGATPGKANSIYTENLRHEMRVTINPNPFSPDADGFEDFAIINFNLPYILSQVRVRVYDRQGRLVRTLEDNRPSASNNSIIFNGLDDDGKALRIGIYILLIEVTSGESSNIETVKVPIVIARKL